jgi:hypothetical protein
VEYDDFGTSSHGFANDALVLFSMLEQKLWVPDSVITFLVVFVLAAMEGWLMKEGDFLML